MTLPEIEAWMEGVQEREENQAALTRLICLYTISPHTKKKLQPRDLFQLPSELRKSIKPKGLSAKKLREAEERWRKRLQ